ncbi:hypothetical protein [Tepidimonas taiwanensis]|uniref:hypothetical protein n=1 Tax=Tepidimonas taiwanensis TaxID=307486 RepID=UPI000AA238A1|nr:hypothetical protein [Tepidimonas taiwanensis]
MDDADRAQIEIERAAERLMQSRRPEGPAATGVCLWCGEPLPMPPLCESAAMLAPRWCDAACRDAWEAHRE